MRRRRFTVRCGHGTFSCSTVLPTISPAGSRFARITFCDKNGKPLPKPVEYLLPVKKNAGWNTAKHELPASAFPAGAESFRVTLAVKRDGGAPAGKLFFGLVRIKLPVTAGTFAKVRGSEFANWFTPGQPVVFKPEGVMPPDALSVTGKVTNEQNELLDTVTVSAAEFEKNGWKYEPKEPGLYYVEFEAKTPNGSISLGEEYMERAMDNRIGLYEQKRQAFAVIPPRRSDGTATPPVFGYQVGYSPNSTRGETEVELIRRAGADFARFHVTWFEIEPEKGKFDWAGLDRLVDKCVKAGIKPVICFYGTPRWASNTPGRHALRRPRLGLQRLCGQRCERLDQLRRAARQTLRRPRRYVGGLERAASAQLLLLLARHAGKLRHAAQIRLPDDQEAPAGIEGLDRAAWRCATCRFTKRS